MRNPDTEEPKIQRTDCKVINRFSTPWRVGIPNPHVVQGSTVQHTRNNYKNTRNGKRTGTLNESSAYAGIVGNCFYNLKNDFFFSLKDLSETLRLKSCQKLNQS